MMWKFVVFLGWCFGAGCFGVECFGWFGAKCLVGWKDVDVDSETKGVKSVGPRKSFISWLLDGEVADGCVDGGEGYGWYAAQVCKDGWQRLELFLLYALLLFLVKLMVILKLCFAMDEDW